MRTSLAVVVCVTLASSLTGLAQPSREELLAGLKAAFGDGILHPDPVFNAPFTADAETMWRPPAASGLPPAGARARYFRDSHGRVRVEQQYVGAAAGQPAQRVIVVPAPNGPLYLLDPAARTVSIIALSEALMTAGAANDIVMPISMTSFVGFAQPGRRTAHGRAVDGQESLGTRAVGGVEAVGERLSATWPFGPAATSVQTTQERWLSTELKVMVSSQTEDSLIGTVEYRLTNISRTEPKAALFAIPAEYREIPRLYPLKWENPHARVEQAIRR